MSGSQDEQYCWFLQRVGADESTFILHNSKKEIRVGCKSENDLIIKNKQASRNHCVLIRKDDSSCPWFIKDLGGTNGTYINQKRIDRNVEVVLLGGERVGIGTPDVRSCPVTRDGQISRELSAVYLVKRPLASTIEPKMKDAMDILQELEEVKKNLGQFSSKLDPNKIFMELELHHINNVKSDSSQTVEAVTKLLARDADKTPVSAIFQRSPDKRTKYQTQAFMHKTICEKNLKRKKLSATMNYELTTEATKQRKLDETCRIIEKATESQDFVDHSDEDEEENKNDDEDEEDWIENDTTKSQMKLKPQGTLLSVLQSANFI